MKVAWQWRLAWRFSYSQHPLFRRFSIFCMVGLGLAISGFILTDTTLRGFDEAYRSALLSFNGEGVLYRDGGILAGDPIFSELKKEFGDPLPFLATPFYYGETLLLEGDRIRGVQIKALRDGDLSQLGKRYRLQKAFSEGSGVPPQSAPPLSPRSRGGEMRSQGVPRSPPKTGGNRGGVFLGKALFEEMKGPARIHLLRLKSDFNRLSMESSFDRSLFVELPVVGTFESGLSEFDQAFIVMGEDAFRSVTGELRAFHGIEFFAERGSRGEGQIEDLAQFLSSPYTFLSWRELNHVFFDALRLERTVFLCIGALIMGIGVLSTVVLTAIQMLERTRERRVLEAIGATRRMRRGVFFKQISFIVWGAIAWGWFVAFAVIGVVEHIFPIALSPEIYFLSALPIRLHAMPFLITAGGIALGGALAIWFALLMGRMVDARYRLH